MMTMADTRSDAVTTAPGVPGAAAIVTFGTLVWLGWTWLVATAIYAIVLTSTVIWGDVDDSLFQSVFAGWQRWLALAAGVTMVTTFLRMLVRNGATRSLLASAATVLMAVVAAIATVLIAIGWGIEKVVYDRQDWLQGLNSGSVFEWSDMGSVFLETPIVIAAYFLSGWLIGAAFYRYGVAGGLALLLPSLVPAAVSELITSKDFGGADIDALPAVGSLPLGATVVLGIALVAATVAVARRLTIGIPLR